MDDKTWLVINRLWQENSSNSRGVRGLGRRCPSLDGFRQLSFEILGTAVPPLLLGTGERTSMLRKTHLLRLPTPTTHSSRPEIEYFVRPFPPRVHDLDPSSPLIVPF